MCSLQLLVLKYVQNKDVFMRYHKAHLTRRLILDISADSEIEENMVEWLRVSSDMLHQKQIELPKYKCRITRGGITVVSCVQTGSRNASGLRQQAS